MSIIPGPVAGGGGGGTDENVKVSANDTTAALLGTKLVAGANVTLTEQNDGSNETLEIAAAAGGFGGQNETLEQGFELYIDDSNSGFRAPLDDEIELFIGGTTRLHVDASAATLSADLLPDSTANVRKLGSNSQQWDDAHFQSGAQVHFGNTVTYLRSSISNYLDLYCNNNLVKRNVHTFQLWYTSGVSRMQLSGSELRSQNNCTLGGTANPWPAIYMEQAGSGVILDADADSYIVGSADDQVDHYIGGSRVARFTASQLELTCDVVPSTGGAQSVGSASAYFDEMYTEADHLANRGSYTTDPVTDGVAPAAPAAGAVEFCVETSSGSEEIWVRFSNGAAKKRFDDT